MSSSPPRVPVEERLFSLVLALLATDSGLTKNEILSTVQGYRQRFQVSGDNSALERQFERDKDDIRDLGVPLETIEAPGEAGNNQNLRYRIPRGEYELPNDVRFTPEETALLGLAAMVWREGSLSGESRRALVKLRSLGVATTEPVLGYAPRLRARDAAFEPLTDALTRRVRVKFSYLKPGDVEPRVRDVAPLALVQHDGRWHLFAEEEGSDEPKTFLLRRIVSPVALTPVAVDPPPGDQTARALDGLDALWQARVAEVAVEAGTDAAARLGHRRGTRTISPGVLEIHYTDENILADELAAFGPEVLVVAPPRVREAVRSRLMRTVSDHV